MAGLGTIKTTITLPAELHWRLQGETVKRRTSNKAAVEQAISEWIDNGEDVRLNSGGNTVVFQAKGTSTSGKVDGTKEPIDTQFYLECARYVLESEDHEAAEALKSNLAAFSKLVALTTTTKDQSKPARPSKPHRRTGTDLQKNVG